MEVECNKRGNYAKGLRRTINTKTDGFYHSYIPGHFALSYFVQQMKNSGPCFILLKDH